MKLITFGYWTAAVDYLWLVSISAHGTLQYTDAQFQQAYEAYDLGTKLDPDFYEFYEQAGVSFAYFYEKDDASLEFLARGIERYESGKTPAKFWTHPVTLYIHAAYTYAFLKNDWARARRTYLRAAEIPGAPHYLQMTKEWMQKEGSERILATNVLKTLIRNTSDATIRKRYEEKLKKYEP